MMDPSRGAFASILLGAALLAPPARAADAATDAMQAAYEPYRAALFRTNAGSVPESRRALASARSAWQQVRDRFAAAAPAPYDRDKAFGTALAAVDAVYQRAAVDLEQGRLAQAHETLEQVRDLLAELRRRNGVVTYSDHVNAYHEQMERLLTQGPGWLDAGAAGLLELSFEAGALDHLATQLRAQAGAALLGDAAFGTALDAVQASSARLRTALRARDADAARKALGELKPPFSRLFLRYG
jgi:hypothetical protein